MRFSSESTYFWLAILAISFLFSFVQQSELTSLLLSSPFKAQQCYVRFAAKDFWKHFIKRVFQAHNFGWPETKMKT